MASSTITIADIVVGVCVCVGGGMVVSNDTIICNSYEWYCTLNCMSCWREVYFYFDKLYDLWFYTYIEGGISRDQNIKYGVFWLAPGTNHLVTTIATA